MVEVEDEPVVDGRRHTAQHLPRAAERGMGGRIYIYIERERERASERARERERERERERGKLCVRERD